MKWLKRALIVYATGAVLVGGSAAWMFSGSETDLWQPFLVYGLGWPLWLLWAVYFYARGLF